MPFSKNNRRLTMENLESRELLAFNAFDQLALELINQARMDPAAEVASNSDVASINAGITDQGDQMTLDPKQPLAPSDLLMMTAMEHTDDMRENDFFSHTGSDGRGALGDGGRIRSKGYDYTRAAENLSVVPYYHSTLNNVEPNNFFPDGLAPRSMEEAVHDLHDTLFASVSHRPNIMREEFRELGVDVQEFSGPWVSFAAHDIGLTTQNYGVRESDAFLTGVVIDDMDNDDFYDIDEGISGVTIVAYQDGVEQARTTNLATGGYALELPDGEYTIVVSGPNVLRTEDVSIAGENVKVDFEAGEDIIAPTITDLQHRLSEGSVALDIMFEDFNPEDTHTITVDWGDGTAPQLFDNATSPASANHTYETAGQQFTATITVEDSSGLAASQPLTIDVPAAGPEFSSVTFTQEALADAPFTANATVDTNVAIGEVTIDFGDGNGSVSMIESTEGDFESSHEYTSPGLYNVSIVATDANGSTTFSEAIHVLPAVSWQNPSDTTDVDNAGGTTPLDALLVINELNNRQHSLATGQISNPTTSPPIFIDVDNDGSVGPLDALLVINTLPSSSDADVNRSSNGDDNLALQFDIDSLVAQEAEDKDGQHRNELVDCVFGQC